MIYIDMHHSNYKVAVTYFMCTFHMPLKHAETQLAGDNKKTSHHHDGWSLSCSPDRLLRLLSVIFELSAPLSAQECLIRLAVLANQM
jgi:hypothetical protein